MAFGSSAMVQFDPEGNRIWLPGGETGVFATATADVTPPPPPSKPTAVVRLGVVTLTWDGLGAEAVLMPADLLHVEVHRSLQSDFYPSDGTLVGVMQPGGSTLVMPDQEYNSLWYYRLVAIDRSGNRSDASLVESATTTPLVSTDIIGQVLDGANFMDGTIDTAALADGSVSGAKIAAGSISQDKLSFTLENGTTVTFDTTAPATPAVGDLWYDGNNGYRLNQWNGSAWVPYTFGGGAIADNSISQSKLSFTLENGTTVTFAPTAPATPAAGDLWYDTDNGNQLAQWSGTQWVVATYGPGAIADNAITETKIATDAVTTPKIAANAVTANEIAANTITANEIAANAVTADEIAANTITAAEIAANTITATEIASNAITADEIAANTITSAEIAANTITAAEIAAGAITADELAANSVVSGKIAAGSISAVEVAANSLTAAVIAAGAIGTDELAANSVVAGKIAANAVTAATIAALAITADKIAANAITSDKIDAGAITTEKLDALLVLAGVMASGMTGRRWEADQYGIRLYDTDDTLLINLPTDPNSPATFKGDVVARSFTSLDQFTMRGTTNEISRDSSLKLAAGYTAPGSPPSVLVYTNNAVITNPNPSAYIYDPRMHGLVRDGSYYYSAQWDNFNGHIYRYNASTLALDTGWNIQIGSQVVDGGVTVLGSYIYALHRTPNSSLWDVSKYLLSTGAWQATYPVTEYLTNFADGYWQGLGNDGTDLLVGYRTTGSSVNITKFSTSGVAGTLITTNISGWLWNVTSVNYGNFDYGAARYVVTAENRENQTNNPLSAVLAYSGSGNVWNLQQNEQWPLPGQTHGMCWDSTLSQFVSLDFSSLTLNFWSGVKWTTESSSWWASTTWYDSNSTGGTHETTQGPRTNFTMRKRASVRTTSSPIPPRPTPNTNDDVMRPRFYLGRGATDPGQSAMWLQTEVADGVNYLEQTGTVAFSGTNPPTTNNFPGANAAQITSSDASSIVIKGDGTGNFGSLVVASGKTNLGTHVLKSTSISTTTVSAATWTNLLFSGTTTINQDSWTLASNYYWTCPTPGTYAIQLRVNLTAAANFKLEMNAESTGDGTVQIMGGAFGGGHDYGQVTIPAIRMSANDRIYTQIYNASGITVNGGVLVVTRLG